MREPERRLIGKGAGLNDLKHAVRNADIGHTYLAASFPPRQQQVSGLPAEEGHGGPGANGYAPDGAGGAVDAARHVDRNHGQSALVQRFDERGEAALDGAREPRPEQSIDHDIGAGEKAGGKRLDGAGPELGHGGSVMGKLGAVPLKPKPDGVTLLKQMARGDKAVAAIVAGTAENGDRARIGEAPRNLVGDGAPGALHQRETKHAALHGKAIGLAHLVRG